MELKIKKGCEDLIVKTPYSPNTTWLRLLEPSLYNYFYMNGYKDFFEVIETIDESDFFEEKNKEE